MAGINAALFVRGQKPLIIDRSMGYIGVLLMIWWSKEQTNLTAF